MINSRKILDFRNYTNSKLSELYSFLFALIILHTTMLEGLKEEDMYEFKNKFIEK